MFGNNFKTILKEERWSKLPTFTVPLPAKSIYDQLPISILPFPSLWTEHPILYTQQRMQVAISKTIESLFSTILCTLCCGEKSRKRKEKQ
jgi:hypothetical protein